jgi:RsiW-degrading membrane proteinase PrsW (M82 family)
MESTIENGRGKAMDPNQAPKRPGGEMKGMQSSQPSKSQLLPFATNAMELTTKPYFIPGLILAILVPLLFTYMGGNGTIQITTLSGVQVNMPIYLIIVAFLLTGGGAWLINRMVGKPRAWWFMPVIMVFTAVMLESPLWNWIKGFFSSSFNGVGRGDGFMIGLIKVVISIGFPEEIFKAIPILIGVYIGRKLIGRMSSNHPTRQFAVLEPLDGIFIGAASGLGFAFLETMFQYIPNEIIQHPEVAAVLLLHLIQAKIPLTQQFYQAFAIDPSSLVPAMYVTLKEAIGQESAAFILNQAARPFNTQGLELLLPRLLGDVTGHAAYSGIFGYFIGLAAMKPQNWIKTALIGLVISAGLHGLWDTVGHYSPSTVWYILISLAAFFGMATLVMKAREISPNRSQLVASQIIDRMAAGLSRSQLVPQGFGQPAASAAVAPTAPGASRSSPVPAHSITYDDGPNALVLEIGAARIPVAIGTRLFERQAPGTRSSAGDSVIGEINANPKEPDVLGIKNLSQQIWHVTTLEGERRELASGRSVRLLRGMRILIGDLYAEVK